MGWSKLKKNKKIYIGMYIKGYTNKEGDFFRKGTSPKEGFPKLRKGVIIDMHSDNYVKVQFENHTAAKDVNKEKSNIIFIKNENDKLIYTLKGLKYYSMWIKRSSILYHHKDKTFIDYDREKMKSIEIKNRRKVEKKFFSKKNSLEQLDPIFIDKILDTFQYDAWELKMDKSIINEKTWLILGRHKQRRKCVPKELPKLFKIEQKYQGKDDYIVNRIKTTKKNKIKIDMLKEKIRKDVKESIERNSQINWNKQFTKYQRYTDFTTEEIQKIVDQESTEIFKNTKNMKK